MIKKIEAEFGEKVEKLSKYQTPGTPGHAIIRDPEPGLSDDEQQNYQSGVGMLLYLVKNTRPDIANAV